MSSDFPRAVVLVLDGLGAGYLGPYGNTWIETPTFNQLASQSWLLEQALIDSPNLELLYRSLWTGRHAARPAPPDSPSAASLLQRLAQAGASTLLITDEAACAASAGPGVRTHAVGGGGGRGRAGGLRGRHEFCSPDGGGDRGPGG